MGAVERGDFCLGNLNAISFKFVHLSLLFENRLTFGACDRPAQLPHTAARHARAFSYLKETPAKTIYAFTHDISRTCLPSFLSINTVHASSIRKEHHMTLPAFTTSQSQSSYEAAGRRLQALIAAPGVQKVQAVTVSRLDHERPEDWRRLLHEIGETAGVRVEVLDGGTVRIGWREYFDA